ncbi:hypothetical protein [Paenibacillus sp. LjRoot56]|uniref:hypothetical protein n=1 Tax=Paenibacillus sp. LjRoot56 TaxID=3342333 RepID=UPI003ECE7BB3
MMKRNSKRWLIIMLQLLGIYIIFKGIIYLYQLIQLMFLSAKGIGVAIIITDFGFRIPANLIVLCLFGIAFLLIGLILVFLPIRISKIKSAR